MHANAPARRWFRPSPHPFSRRVLASLGLGVTYVSWRPIVASPTHLWIAAPLALAAVLLHFDHRLCRLVFRTVAWSHVACAYALGLLLAAASLYTHDVSSIVALPPASGAGAALLLLRRTPIEIGIVGRHFVPVAYRRSLLFGCAALLGAAYDLASVGHVYWTWGIPTVGAVLDAQAALVLAAAVGVLRKRAWGAVVAAAAATTAIAGVGVATVVRLPSAWDGAGCYDSAEVGLAFALAAAGALVVLAPIAVARVRLRSRST